MLAASGTRTNTFSYSANVSNATRSAPRSWQNERADAHGWPDSHTS